MWGNMGKEMVKKAVEMAILVLAILLLMISKCVLVIEYIRKKMKALIIILCLLTSCAWSRQDKIFYASYLALSAVDAIQTSQFSKEYNPLLQDRDGSPDMTKVIAYKAIGGLGIYFLADYFSKARTPILISVIAIQGGVVIGNSLAW